MTGLLEPRAIGTSLERLDGRAKVTGTAPYAFEHPVDNGVYLHPVQSSIARGRITAVDATEAEALDGVIAVLTPANAPRLVSGDDRELAVLQSDEVGFRGQFVAAVVAESSEIARQAADMVGVTYDRQPHDTELRADRDDLYAPGVVNPDYPTDTSDGDPDGAFASAAVTIDETYTTPMEHNNPMEPHATVALWAGDALTLYDSTQGPNLVRDGIAGLFGLPADRVRVIAPHVGGGFGSKTLHANVVLAAVAARVVAGRPVKFALTRQQMFSLVGYRTPTIQRIRLGADSDGRLTAITHDVIEQTSRIKEFAEQTAVPTRSMYAAPNRRTTHRLAALDVPVPTWMRGPGECPGMYVVDEAREFREKYGPDPEDGDEAGGAMPDNPDTERFAMHAYGAQFAEVRVHADTGEIRVPRLLGVFAAGRIINPRTARSQFVGAMTMGLSMALHEDSVMDPRFGQVANHDFAGYHIATNADIGSIDAIWIEEDDPHVNAMGSKGIGEIGIVGTAAAIANAAHHATGIRIRDLPLTADKYIR
jgi:CO/xanthine dehydrogenase Mo-binding subunit